MSAHVLLNFIKRGGRKDKVFNNKFNTVKQYRSKNARFCLSYDTKIICY